MSLPWEFYFSRKRITIRDFIKDTSTLEEARKKFSDKKLTVPDDEVLEPELLFWKGDRVKQEEAAAKPKPTTPRRGRPKKKAKVSDTPGSQKDEKYFRKVFPSKKSKK